mgnify:CR=1 FL=1
MLKLKGFNPTMVRLLRSKFRHQNRGAKVVSIPQWCDCCPSQIAELRRLFGGFNPTMVRLLRDNYQSRCSGDAWFQSHNGAIAALDIRRLVAECVCFNPTMVRLLPVISQVGSPVLIRFNPTMVRLLQIFVEVRFANSAKFQSHNGAIAALGALKHD